MQKLNDPLRKWEEMQKLNDPLRKWEEMQKLNDPLRKWEEMQKLNDPLRKWEEMQKLNDPLRKWEEMQKLNDPLRKWEEMQRSASTQVQRMLAQYLPENQVEVHQDALPAATGFNVLDPFNAVRPANEHHEWFNRLQRQVTGGLSLQDLARQLELANPALTALQEAQRSLGGLAGSFRNIDFSQFAFGEQEEHEAEQAAHAITQAPTTELTLPAAVAQIIAAIEAQRSPVVRLTLLFFFWKLVDYIMSGIIGAVISQHMPQAAPQSPPQAIKSMKASVRASVESPSLLTEYRIVTAKALRVRQNPKSRSPQLGLLGFGKVVKLLRKDKDFALVLWRDTESGTEIQGWVFARYLEKFN
jgi:hypothetical protein